MSKETERNMYLLGVETGKKESTPYIGGAFICGFIFGLVVGYFLVFY